MSFHKFTINGEEYEFQLWTKTHQWLVWITGRDGFYVISKAKGQAIIDFLLELEKYAELK